LTESSLSRALLGKKIGWKSIDFDDLVEISHHGAIRPADLRKKGDLGC
jgi:hypothetical protein